MIEVKIQFDYLKEILIGRQEMSFITSKEKVFLDNLRNKGFITELQFVKYNNFFLFNLIRIYT